MTDRSDSSGRVPDTDPPAVVSPQPRAGGVAHRWRRPKYLIASALILAVLLSGSIWFALASGSSSKTAPATGPSPAETAAVMQLLEHHATALTDRDSSAWSADLDSAAPAQDFAAHQREVYTNLTDVPLTVWRYTLVAPVTSPDQIAAAAARLGGRVVILHVRLEYALRTVDPQPTAKDLWLTGVRRAGGWKLAGDSDVAQAGGASWKGPWDFGPLRTRSGAHTLVLAHPDHFAALATFGDLVERSVPVVTSVWGSGWNDHVAVLIPDSSAEFAAVTSDSADTSDLAAVAVADQVTSTGTVLGARIVLNPSTLSRLDAAGRRLVVQHELTHIAARAQTSDQMPTWVIEGFADYVGNLGSGQSVPATAAELANEVRRGIVPAALPSTADFGGANSRLAQVYEQSWLACRLIASRAGQSGLVRFYRTVSSTAAGNPDGAVGVGLRDVLHTTPAAFTLSWKAYLRAELR
ncbi:MAG TPA: hypothetical protein VGH11_04840 [Jatrophihabitans sp.]